MYNSIKNSWIKHLDFMILDIVILELSYVLAYVIRHGLRSPFDHPIYQRMGILLLLVDICVVFFGESYAGVVRRGYYREFIAVIKHCTIVSAIVLAYLFFVKQAEDYSRSVFIQLWGINIVLSYFSRLVLKKIVRRRLLHGSNIRSILVVGKLETVRDIVNNLNLEEYTGYRVSAIAILNADMRGKKIQGIPIVAGCEDVFQYAKGAVVDEVFIDLPGDEKSTLAFTDKFLDMGITVHTNLAKLSEGAKYKEIEKIGSYAVLTTSIKMASARDIFIKRLMDICGGIVGLLITGLMTIVIGPIIYFQSPGPIFFSQTRVGKNGRKFKIYKFRSMCIDAEEKKKELIKQNKMKGQIFKVDDDPRIIPIGHFIRKWSIDEFPQFFNVLKGDMSLIGTRPPTVDEYEKYEEHHRRRLAIKPGLTGMWQISGRSDIEDFEEIVELDSKYISEWTIGLDIKILLKTIMVVILGKGSQ